MLTPEYFFSLEEMIYLNNPSTHMFYFISRPVQSENSNSTQDSPFQKQDRLLLPSPKMRNEE